MATYSKFVGRVGALAIALGIGSAVGLPAGVAWADPEPDTRTSADAGTSPSTPDTATADSPSATPDHGSTTAEATSEPGDGGDPAPGSATTVEVSPGVTISHSGGVHSSTHGTAKDPDGDDDEPASAPVARTTTHRKGSKTPSAPSPTPAPVATARTVTGSTAAAASAVPAPATSDTHPPTPTAVTLTSAAAPSTAVVRVPTISSTLHAVIAPVLAALFGTGRHGGAAAPLAWVFAAAARRDLEPVHTPVTSSSVTSSATATAPNNPPTVAATYSTPDPTTGAVTGKLTATDPEGKKVSISVTTTPTVGTLTYRASTATFTYTPTAAQRIAAGVTPGADTVAMTVTVSDGVNRVPVQIDVPVSAVPISVRTDLPGVAGGGAIAATNNRLYVTDRTAGTVTVVDTGTGAVVGTYAAGTAPDGLVVKPDGTRLYVSSSTGNTVTILDPVTGAVKKTVAVANPTAIAISPSGRALYVTNGATGTVTRISTVSAKIDATIKLPAGSIPTGITVSPDTTRIYVTTTTGVLVFASSSRTATPLIELDSTPTISVVSANNARLYVGSASGVITVVDTKTRAVVDALVFADTPAAIAVTRDGSALLVTDPAGRVRVLDTATGDTIAAMATTGWSASVLSPDGAELYVSDGYGVVHAVSLTAPNTVPSVGTPTSGIPKASNGAVTGTVGVTDADGDRLVYTVTGAPAKGKLVVKADGTFTYTPTVAARHAAAAIGASTTDSFTVTVSDGRRGVVSTTIEVDVLPSNRVPTVKVSVGSPNSTTGIVSGSVKGADGDKDALSYAVTTSPSRGTVTLTPTGGFTYTPTAAARHAAMRTGATTADKQDTFTVTVSDGHGGVATATVTVKISPTNAKPTGGAGAVTSADPETGVATGTLTAVDADGDTLTYTAVAPKKGTVVIDADGTFAYTPTTAARIAASAPTASAAAKAEAVTFTVLDGYGGTASFVVSVPITPYSPGNIAPADAHGTVTNSSTAVGAVTGRVTAVDPNGDPLTYTVTGGPAKGVVTIDAGTGVFTYTPDVAARYTALVTPEVDQDAFTVSISDGRGGLTSTTVTVTIVTPTANQVDQRPTTVAVHASDLLFYSQAQLNTALDALQSTGIDTIRITIPWAAVEPLPGIYNWSTVDRLVNGAAARDIKVLAVINSTPLWAAVANTLPLAGMPKDNAVFANFAKTVATRYKGKVTAYEVWNEPNGIQFWQPAPNAAQYTALLKAAYTAIKTADPNAVVVAAAVGAVIDFGNFTVNPVRFVSEMYAAGAAGYFDALSFHPYLYNKMFSKTGTTYDAPLSQANRIHQLMVANGDGNKKIWATEYGQPDSLVSEDSQAAYLGDFLRTWRTLSYAGPAFIHSLVDTDSDNEREASFGLFHLDWTPKPALTTVEQVIDENEAIEAGL